MRLRRWRSVIRVQSSSIAKDWRPFRCAGHRGMMYGPGFELQRTSGERKSPTPSKMEEFRSLVFFTVVETTRRRYSRTSPRIESKTIRTLKPATILSTFMTHGYARVISIFERKKLLKAVTAAFQNQGTDILKSPYCLLIVATLINSARAMDDPWVHAPLVLHVAEAWHVGDSIPEEFRRFRKSAGDLPVLTDSEYLISQVTNLSLLAALAADVSADAKCREDA